ncbi:MAG TPA: response regulator, partial [Desulfurivibrionaceae bacterium]|nr:response regulator [Desulfurivibrionaceae bacterium]
MEKQLMPFQPVLLVDDEEAWLHSFSLTLRSVGINNITCCADSRKVLGLLAEQPASVVVLDLTMPHLSGEELLPQLVAEHPGIPVIIITGLDLVDTAVNCMRLGAFDYYT